MAEHFAIRAGLGWGYGIGIGSGGMMLSSAANSAQGPLANVYVALSELSDRMILGETGCENQFVTPKYPRFLYKLGGNMGWRQLAKRTGTQRSLSARPHLS